MQQTAHHHSPLNTAGFAHPARNVHALGLDQGMSVADFGSGSGAYVFAIAEVLANTGDIYAIDVQKDLLRRIHNESLKRGFKNVHILWADLEQPRASKIAGNTLDFVLISNLLFQLEDKHAPLKEAHRILKPTGKLAMIDWSDSYGGMGPQKKDVVTKDAGLLFAQHSGFESLREFEAGAHHWGVIMRKIAQK